MLPPSKDKLVGLWWFFVALGILCGLISMVLIMIAVYQWTASPKSAFVVYPVSKNPI
jgi:hypothetical protein